MAPKRCVEKGCRRFVKANRNFCDECTSPCWCPCDCGCEEPNFVVNPSGLCPDCENNNHEVPPDQISRNVEALLPLYESIVAQYRNILKRDPICKEFLKKHDFVRLTWEWDKGELIAYREPADRGDEDEQFRVNDFEIGSLIRVAFEDLKKELLELDSKHFAGTDIY